MTYQLWMPTETQFCFLKQKMPFKNLVYDPVLLIYKFPSFPFFLCSNFEIFGLCEKLLFFHNFYNTEFVIERAYFEG